MARKIVIIAFNGAQLLDITGPLQVFASANDELGSPAYEIIPASIDGARTQTTSGLALETVPLSSIDPEGIDTCLVVGGFEAGVARAARSKELRLWLRACAHSVRRLGSVCSGTFILAAAGLIEGRHVATHWRSTSLLARLYPTLDVDKDAIYVRDGRVWTSAGVTTGIDMTLALVAEDVGQAVAMAIARRLVVYAHRPGGQSQFSALLEGQAQADGPLSATINWMNEQRSARISVADCAARAGMSERTFYRRFEKATGMPPARYLEALRLEAARALLEREAAPLKQVAALAGFSGPQQLIQVFEKRLGLTPTDYRKLHGTRPAA